MIASGASPRKLSEGGNFHVVKAFVLQNHSLQRILSYPIKLVLSHYRDLGIIISQNLELQRFL